MKQTEKLAALALVCVMALTALTACSSTGGTGTTGGSSAGGTSTSDSASDSNTSGSSDSNADTDSDAADEETVEKLISFTSSRLYKATAQNSSDNIQLTYNIDGSTTVISKLGTKLHAKAVSSDETLEMIIDGDDAYLLNYSNGSVEISDAVIKLNDDTDYIENGTQDAYKYYDTIKSLEYSSMLLEGIVEGSTLIFAPESGDILAIKSGKITYGGTEYYAETVLLRDYSTTVYAVYAFEDDTIKYVFVLNADDDYIGLGKYGVPAISKANQTNFVDTSNAQTIEEYLREEHPDWFYDYD